MYSACDKKRRCGVRLNRQKIGRNPHSWYDKHDLPGRQMSTRGPSEVRKSSLRGPQVRVTSKYTWCLLELLEGSVRSSQLILCANLLFCHDQLWQVYKTALLTGNTGAQTFKVPLEKFCSQYILLLSTCSSTVCIRNLWKTKECLNSHENRLKVKVLFSWKK